MLRGNCIIKLSPVDLNKEEKIPKFLDEVDVDELHQHDLMRGVQCVHNKDKYLKPKAVFLGEILRQVQ